MPGKLQRNDRGKLYRRESGKVGRVFAEDECCCDPFVICARVNAPECTGPQQAVPIIYKVVVEEVVPLSGFGNDNYEIITGHVNRTYYIAFGRRVTAIRTFPGQGQHNVPVLWCAGWYLTGKATPATDAVRFKDRGAPNDDAYRSYSLHLQFHGSAADIATNRFLWARIGIQLGGLYIPSNDPQFFISNDETDVFCEQELEVENEADGPYFWPAQISTYALGRLGKMTITPCPPCAVDCAGSTCATVEGPATGLAEVSGIFTFLFRSDNYFQVAQSIIDNLSGPYPNESVIAPPAGCVWVYRKFVIDLVHWLNLYIWFDGQDYQGIITGYSNTNEAVVCRTYTAGAIECVDGKLAGTIVLKQHSADFPAGTTLSEAVTTVTLTEDCDDCYTVEGRHDSNTIDYFNGGATFSAGDYRITYDAGALEYEPGEALPWGINFNNTSGGYRIDYNGGGAAVDAPMTDSPATRYATQAAAEAANVGATVDISHTGGAIGIKLNLDSYAGINPGSPNPTYTICPIVPP